MPTKVGGLVKAQFGGPTVFDLVDLGWSLNLCLFKISQVMLMQLARDYTLNISASEEICLKELIALKVLI